MSGPKSADYYVADNLAVRAAARAQAWGAAREIQARLDALLRRARETASKDGFVPIATSGVPNLPDASADTLAIDQYVATARAAYSRLEGELERAIIGKRTARMLSALVAGVSEKLTTAEDALSGRMSSREAHEDGQTTIDMETRRSRTRRAMERMEGFVAQTERDAIEQLAFDTVSVAEKVNFENLVLELQVRIQRANEEARQRQVHRERAAQLLVALRGLAGPDVEEITRELQKVDCGEQLLRTNIEQRVEAVSQAAQRRADRDYAGRVIREEFERLGYQVEEGFQTAFVRGGTINLRKPAMKEYGARMRVGPEQGRLDFQVVRSGSAGEAVSQERRTRDKEAEDEWCSDLAHIMAAIRQRSVQSRITQRVPSGAQPVVVVETEGGAAHRREEDDQLASRQA